MIKFVSGRGEFDYLDTAATRMLKAGLDNAASERGLSMRAAARELGYKASVVISHMAAGRVPIPLERAADIARVVGLPVGEFCIAVLKQRYPGAFQELVGAFGSVETTGLAQELELLAGQPLDSLPAEHKRVLREVVSERDPDRRWLSLAELPVALALRQARPDLRVTGLDRGEIDKIVTVTSQSKKGLRRPST